jgi:heme oxygenase
MSAGPGGLAFRLRTGTRRLHAAVERAGVMPTLLQGRLDRTGYCRLLDSLQAIYLPLEAALRRHAAHPCIAPLALGPLFRADAIAADLAVLGTVSREPPPTAALDYAAHLARLDAEDPMLLVAHAYVRYLGDLSGGQRLRMIVAQSFALAPGTGTDFYDFGPPATVAQRAAALRAGLDALPLDETSADAVVAEARGAFERHGRLFEALAGERPPEPADAHRGG